MIERGGAIANLHHRVREAIKERISYPQKEQVLGFFQQIQRFPDGMAIGFHGTTDISLPKIQRSGLREGFTNYYRLDPRLDTTLQRDLSREDWQTLFARLERTIVHAVRWGLTAMPASKKTAIVIFFAEPRHRINQRTPEETDRRSPLLDEFPAQRTNYWIKPKDIFMHFTKRSWESYKRFGKRVTRELLKCKISPEEADQHMKNARISLRGQQKLQEEAQGLQ